MWSVSITADPLWSHPVLHHRQHHSFQKGSNGSTSGPSSVILVAQTAIHDLLGGEANQEMMNDFSEGGKGARAALADFVARGISEQVDLATVDLDGVSYSMELLDRALVKNRRRKAKNSILKYPPYILERSDIWCSETDLHVTLRMRARTSSTTTSSDGPAEPAAMVLDDDKKAEENSWEGAARFLLGQVMSVVIHAHKIMEQVACLTLQRKLRRKVQEMKAVAFIADGSILPRKSGTSDAPMSSPPAIPFKAPADSPMTQETSVEIGSLGKYLRCVETGSTTVHFRGLVVWAGITLICGGGYHGKSTMLQTIATGVYDKIPGDGRECCVAVPDAVSVRAEDGRYVNNCNISAFISNLPTLPGTKTTVDTKHFSTRDSSGSTSQAANVSEAIEMGCSAMLIDEDISAANFMARDGRMRSLVMDESITPLLYRVNGLYNSHGISSVVVVGGVGDWLDVPHNVILLDKYVASDATKKAQSISYQFSHGHVQYAGRGVVHRLEWENSGTPIPRRPVDTFRKRFSRDIFISVMDGGHALSFHEEDQDEAETDADLAMDDDDEGCIEASRFEQLLSRKQLFGCGMCVLWILQVGSQDEKLGLPGLLDKLDSVLDQGGLMQVLTEINNFSDRGLPLMDSDKWRNIVEEVGFAQRPRKYEAGQALTRMYGIQLEEIQMEIDNSEELAKQEAEKKRQELLKIWENRRRPAKSRFV